MAFTSDTYVSLYAGLIIAFTILATICLVLRLLARWITHVRFGFDDTFIVIAWVFLIGMTIDGSIFFFNAGADGTSPDDIGPDRMVTLSKSFYAGQILYYFTMLPTKLSVLSLYLRLFTPQKLRIAIYVMITISCAWFLGGLIPTIVQCLPIEFNWNKGIEGSCLAMKTLFAGITISNLLTDAIILLMPIPVLLNLNMSWSRRWAVIAIFLSGCAPVLCALLRVVSQSFHFFSSTAAQVDCVFWIAIEPPLAVLSACLPCLRPLVKAKGFSTWYSSRFGSTVSGSNSSGRKSRSSWFGLGQKSPGVSGMSKASNGTVTTTAYGEADDYPLKAYNQHENYALELQARAECGHVKKGSKSTYESGPCLGGITVCSEITIEEMSVR